MIWSWEGHGQLSKFHLSQFLDLTPLKNRKCKTAPLGVLGLGESSCSREWLAEDEMQKHMQAPPLDRCPSTRPIRAADIFLWSLVAIRMVCAPKSRDGGVMMAPQQAVSVWLICIGVAYVWGHRGEALDELSLCDLLKMAWNHVKSLISPIKSLSSF